MPLCWTKAEYAEKMKELANPFKKKVDGKFVYVPYKTLGKNLTVQMGCVTCHSTTETDEGKQGPSWMNLYKTYYAVQRRPTAHSA